MKESDLSGYHQYYHPMADEQEMEYFQRYDEHLIGKPRKIKRIINSYMISREISQLHGIELPSFREKLLKLVILTEQWPYRITWLMLIAENLQQERSLGNDVRNQLPQNSDIISVLKKLFDKKEVEFLDIPLVEIYHKIVFVLMHSPPDAHVQVQRDGDPQDFVKLLSSREGNSQLLLSDIALPDDDDAKTRMTLRPYMFNLPQHMQEKMSIHLENCLFEVDGQETGIPEQESVNTRDQMLRIQFKKKSSLFDQSSTKHTYMTSQTDLDGRTSLLNF